MISLEIALKFSISSLIDGYSNLITALKATVISEKFENSQNYISSSNHKTFAKLQI